MADVMAVIIVVTVHVTGEGQVMTVVIAVVVMMVMVVTVQPRTRHIPAHMPRHTGPHRPGGLQWQHEYQEKEQGTAHGVIVGIGAAHATPGPVRLMHKQASAMPMCPQQLLQPPFRVYEIYLSSEPT